MGFFDKFKRTQKVIPFSYLQDDHGYYQITIDDRYREFLFATDTEEKAASAVDMLTKKFGDRPYTNTGKGNFHNYIEDNQDYPAIVEQFEVEEVFNGNVMKTFDEKTKMIQYHCLDNDVWKLIKGYPVKARLAVAESEEGIWMIDHIYIGKCIDYQGFSDKYDAIYAANKYLEHIEEDFQELEELLEDEDYWEYLENLHDEFVEDLEAINQGKTSLNEYQSEELENPHQEVDLSFSPQEIVETSDSVAKPDPDLYSDLFQYQWLETEPESGYSINAKPESKSDPSQNQEHDPNFTINSPNREPKVKPASESSLDQSPKSASVVTMEKPQDPESPDKQTAKSKPSGFEGESESLKKLESLIGLSMIKNEIKEMIRGFIGQRRLKAQGITTKKPLLHMIFEGSPGTGKTEVARLIAGILHEFDYIQMNKCIEVSRKDLVGKYIGHTAKETSRWIQKAKGGVLFIDEAYTLANGGDEDFGHEAIEVILKAMEDMRDEIVFIFAGYSYEMSQFLAVNPGMESRIGKIFQFTDYTPKEVREISVNILQSSSFILTDETEKAIKDEIKKSAQNGVIPGNARWARSFTERILSQHHIRISDESVQDVTVIRPESVKEAGSNRLSSRDEEGMKLVRDEALAELNKMVGLDDLKHAVGRILNYIFIQKEREKKGLHTELNSLHMAFTGPPGTGKTTVARIIGKFLNGSGVLEKGHFIEAGRSDLVGRYVGETSLKVKALVEKAKGGILFIDEAYSLVQGERDEFGQEAVDTLIALMENHRRELVVILAGYEDDIKRLLETNPGFDSRIRNHFNFPALNDEALFSIISKGLKDQDYQLSEETNQAIFEYISQIRMENPEEIYKGNGRWARNQIDRIVLNQSDRLTETRDGNLEIILPSDIYD